MENNDLRKLMHERLDKSLNLLFSKSKGEIAMANIVIGIHDEPWKNEEHLYEGRSISIFHLIVPTVDSTFEVDDASYTVEKYGEQADTSKTYQLDFSGDTLQIKHISSVSFEEGDTTITKNTMYLHPRGVKRHFEGTFTRKNLISSKYTHSRGSE